MQETKYQLTGAVVHPDCVITRGLAGYVYGPDHHFGLALTTAVQTTAVTRVAVVELLAQKDRGSA
jgi:hypothetical protein